MRRKLSLGRLLAGVSVGAASLAMATLPASVRAQAVQGTATVQFGANAPTYNSSTNTDTVFVTANEALIDWNVTSTTGQFLPNGATLQFNADTGSPYTVLNRVTDSASTGPLSISGTVQSDSLGRIWFYNPSGWVVGSTGVFNVGSLVLTSLPITVDPSTDTVSRLYGDKNEIRFGTALDPTSTVSVLSGAQVNATMGSGSYVAMVAPRVEQGGTVSVNGSAAYVGAEAATMTINNGLFDIVIDSGSSDDAGVVHTGTTQWPAGNDTSSDTVHRAYLVAVPKNQAMTAVVSGSLGYDGASSAQVVDGTIVLSAGYNVVNGDVDRSAVVGGNASLRLSGLTVGAEGATNNVDGHATGNVAIDAAGVATHIHGNATLDARGNLSAIVDEASLSVDGGLSMASADGAKAGNVSITASNGASVTVGGALELLSSATGTIQTDPENGDALLGGAVGEDASAGNIGIAITNSNFSAASTRLSSTATAGLGGLAAGNSSTGSVSISVTQAGGAASTQTVSLGNLELYSTADIGNFGAQQPTTGGTTQAGDVSLQVNGGIFGTTRILAASQAFSASGVEPTALDATAGTVSIAFANGHGTVSTGAIQASNYALAQDGGFGAAGNVTLAYDKMSSDTSDSFGFIDLQSTVHGNQRSRNTVSLSLTGGSTLDTFGNYVSLFAGGRDATGTQFAGDISFLNDASTLSAGALYISSQAIASSGGVNALGGNVSITMRNSSDTDLLDGAYIDSIGRGGNGTSGGNGTGGTVTVGLSGSRFAGFLDVLSLGVAGRRNSLTGLSGTGRGGSVSFDQSGKAAELVASTVTVASTGLGGQASEGARNGLSGQIGDGAAGIGGEVAFTISDGTFDATDLTVMANGEGGGAANAAGGQPAKGGLGQGGTASFTVSGGLTTVTNITVTAPGLGGDGARSSDTLNIGGGEGGAGTGGSASASLTGGTVNTSAFTVEANGNKSVSYYYGGTSYFGNGGYDFGGLGSAGNGGQGTGGSALLTVDGGALGAIVQSGRLPLSVSVNAIGEGGAGGYGYAYNTSTANNSGSGGSGTGGTAIIRYLSGLLDAETISANASGLGGLAGNDAYFPNYVVVAAGSGGSGTGGNALFEIAATFDTTTTVDQSRSIAITADGLGHAGERGVSGGAGGNGRGGSASLSAIGGNTLLIAPTLSAEGLGGRGGDSSDGSNGGSGGAGVGGNAFVSVDGEGAQLSLQDGLLHVSGQGGRGASGGSGSESFDEAGNGGNGGAGTGGQIGFTATGLGQLQVSGASGASSFEALGLGGQGGLGGNAALNFGSVQGDGGNGGIGRGGAINATASSGGQISFDDLTVSVSGTGGDGGAREYADVGGALETSVGGIGGAGFGGAISLSSDGEGSRISAPGFVARAEGQGGSGVDGDGYTSGRSANGSAGGNGTGGTFDLVVNSAGAIDLAATDGNVLISVDGFGGNGGSALAAIGTSGASGGDGGAGGAGLGGTIGFAANAGGSANLGLFGSTSLSASGTGGLGGAGGNGASATATDTFGGNGGNAGLSDGGSGGTIGLAANGGALRFGDLGAVAQGTTQFGGFAGAPGAGPAGPGSFGSASAVGPVGGRIEFSSGDDESGGQGQFAAGNTSANVTSSFLYTAFNGFSSPGSSGTISISRTSSALSDGMRFASFTGNANGTSAGGDPSIAVSADGGAIEFDTDLSLYSAGNISLQIGNGAAIGAGGAAYIQADGGISLAATGTGKLAANSIELRSSGVTDIASVDCATDSCRTIEATTDLILSASGGFNLTGPAIAAGLGSIDLYTAGDLTGDAHSGFFSEGDVALRAGGNATIRNVSGANVVAEAGIFEDYGYEFASFASSANTYSYYYDALLTLGEEAGGGTLAAAGNMAFNSGGGIAVTNGNTFTAGSGFALYSGNDIVVGAGNSFRANTVESPTPGAVVFAAGGQPIDYGLDGNDIATLSFGGGTIVDAGSGSIALSGAAIDARLASFTGASFRADVLDSLAPDAIRRDDGGRLDPDCLEGAVCIGHVTATGLVRIGNGDVAPLDILSTGRISGSSIALLAIRNVTLSGMESAAELVASGTGEVSVRAGLGDIALLNGAVVQGGTIRLRAGGSLTGTGRITSTANDIGLTVGGDIDATSLAAARELTTFNNAGGSAEAQFTTPGALRVGSLTLGADARITAGSDLRIGQLSLNGFNGTFNAGLIDLGSTSGVNNLSLIATGRIDFGELVVGGNLELGAATIAGTGAVAGGTISVTADDFSARNLESGGNLAISAKNSAKLGSVISTGGSVAIDPILLTFDSIEAADSITLGGGTITGGTLLAGTSIDVNATGPLTLSSATAVDGITLSAGGAMAYGQLDGGSISLTGGSVNGGTLRARTGDLNLYSSGSAGIGAVDAAGNVAIDASDLTFTTVNAGGAFATSNASMTGTSIRAGQGVSISSGGDVALAGLSGTTATISSSGAVNISGIRLSGDISVFADAVALDAAGNLGIRRIVGSNGNVNVTAGGSILADTIQALGDIGLTASNGDVVVSHLSAGYADVFSDALRPAAASSGVVGQGNIDIVASRDIVINDVADAAKAFTMNAGRTIRLNGLASGATMDLSSADLEIGATGQLGETAHTSAIRLSNSGTGVTRLGDNLPAATNGGYAVSQAEFARIRSRGDLTVTGSAPLLVGDLAVVAQAGNTQGQIGETGTLSLQSSGLISFLGALSVSNAAGNTLSASGSSGIFLDAASGSIRLLDGSSGAGSLLLSGSGIAMVTRAALEDISQLSDTALITERLGLNDGVTADRTLVEAGAIDLRSDREVYIQNTSASTALADRRGLVAESLSIGSRDGGTLDIVINGVVKGATGIDAIDQITFAEGFTDLSSVNGCVIANAGTCNKVPFEVVETRDLIEEVLKEDPADAALPVVDSFTKTTLIQLNQIAPAGFEPLIDEPVTGTGNDDLLGDEAGRKGE